MNFCPWFKYFKDWFEIFFSSFFSSPSPPLDVWHWELKSHFLPTGPDEDWQFYWASTQTCRQEIHVHARLNGIHPVPRSNPTEKTMKSGRILYMKYTNSCVTFFLRWVFDHFLQIFLTFLQVVSLTLPKAVSNLFFCKKKCYKESVFQLVFKMVLRQYHEDGFWPFLADSILLFLKIIL